VADFKFGYWGALLGMMISGIVSYLRLRYVEGIATAIPNDVAGTEFRTD
jgi:hypothetical protein